MATSEDSIQKLRSALIAAPVASSGPQAEILALIEHVQQVQAKANSNAGHNTYLWRNEAWTLQEAHRAAATLARHGCNAPALCGIPISVKDCFDLAGSPTTCGTKFYRDLHGNATHDSWLVESLRAAGAIITGKTHLHPLAYGITGENPDFGDCLQPGHPGALTGGSSSGAAASVMEGSALAAIGTDTGGSIRVPAALCGLDGYRTSLGRGDWRGGAHLAESFDTFGWLFRNLEDGPLLASIFGPAETSQATLPRTFAIPSNTFFDDCEPAVLASLRTCQMELEALGLTPVSVSVEWWSDSREIFAAIQASEAARIHHGHFANFEDSIRQRLEWGASLTAAAVSELRHRHTAFRNRMDTLLSQHALLLLPAAPVVRLAAGADHTQTRPQLLRYTTPVSLAGIPAVTIPCFDASNPDASKPAGGMQLAAAREDDARLLAIAAKLGAARNQAASIHPKTPP
jgi:Asp-tRNA(Asn)/Glu-tRNA(Gln) amidotransferase A subunit family amidase